VFFENSLDSLEVLVAKAANIINKPFLHSVVKVSDSVNDSINDLDLTLNVLCRDLDGKRLELYDMEIEIFNSKNELVLVIAKLNYPDEPILWSGNKNLWLNSISGKRSEPPKYNLRFENLATRIKTFIN
tara:strand:+ start:856 stop:1242 length:387 start_codon:yes stop_codon:yes gene_type:complete